MCNDDRRKFGTCVRCFLNRRWMNRKNVASWVLLTSRVVRRVCLSRISLIVRTVSFRWRVGISGYCD